MQKRLAGADYVAGSDTVFDQLGRTTDLTHRRADTIFADYDLEWDAAGRITDLNFDFLGCRSDDETDYTYDKTSQLEGATYINQSNESYTYDDNGNRALVDGTDSYTTGDPTFNTVRDVVEYVSGSDSTALRNHIDYDAFGRILAESNANVVTVAYYTGRYRDLVTGLQYNRARWYHAHTGRWLSEDPIGSEGKDANLYRYSSNNPPVRVDPLGLEWQVDRKGEPRAIATCERCDRVEDLAKKLDLWPSEFRKWLKDEDGKGLPETAETEMTESRKFSVPNTAYLHVGKWQVGPIRWALKGYEDGLKSRLEKAGLLVDYNAPTSVALMAAQLPSPDVFVFACFGHGIFGCLQPNPLQSHENFSDTNLMPKTYTQFGIAEMHLIACETHAGDWEWRADAARSIPGRSAKPGIRASRRVGNRRAVRARIGAPHYNLGEAARRQTERSHGPLR